MDGTFARRGVSIGTAVAICVFAGSAAADDVLMSFGFTDLDTAYDANTNLLTAVSVDAGNLNSGGDVSRLVGSIGDAEFDSGFESLGTLANFDLSMSISNVLADTADGAGSLLITDSNGDTIAADISGEWSLLGGLFYVFEGELGNVFVNDNSGDGQFDGPTGGAFSTSFLTPQPLYGAAVYLYFGAPGGFFSQSFDGVSGQISGEIVPAPGAAALLGLAGLVATRRRRFIA